MFRVWGLGFFFGDRSPVPDCKGSRSPVAPAYIPCSKRVQQRVQGLCSPDLRGHGSRRMLGAGTNGSLGFTCFNVIVIFFTYIYISIFFIYLVYIYIYINRKNTSIHTIYVSLYSRCLTFHFSLGKGSGAKP